jgi:hypothetical protein
MNKEFITQLGNFLNPKNQNRLQKSGFFAFLSIAALTVVLHFPFNGYSISRDVVDGWDYSGCIRNGYLKFSCGTPIYRAELLPFTAWGSASPVIPWFGNIVNALVSLLFAFFLGAAWLFIFRDDNTFVQK